MASYSNPRWQAICNALDKVNDLATRQKILRIGARKSLIALLKYINGEDSFSVQPVHEFISREIESRIHLEDTSRLCITAPPRCGKSLLAIAALAMVTGRNGLSKSIVGTAVTALSNDFYKEYLRILKNERFTEVFPEFQGFMPKSDDLVEGGKFKITSPRSRLSGFTAGGRIKNNTINGILLLDDINASSNPADIKQANQFVEEQFYRRVAYEGTFYLIIGTVYSSKDTIETIIKKDGLYSETNPTGWKRYIIPALCENAEEDVLERPYQTSLWEDHATLNKNSLLALKQRSHEIFEALFQGKPTEKTSQIVKNSSLKPFPARRPYAKLYSLLALDTAIGLEDKNDETVITIASVCCFESDSTPYLAIEDQVAGHFLFNETLDLIKEKMWEYSIRDCIIEQSSAGAIVSQQLETLGGVNINKFNPSKSKEIYLRSIIDVLEKYVFFHYDRDFYPDLRQQLLDFPYDKHDDRVDSVRLVIQEFIRRESNNFPKEGVPSQYGHLLLAG